MDTLADGTIVLKDLKTAAKEASSIDVDNANGDILTADGNQLIRNVQTLLTVTKAQPVTTFAFDVYVKGEAVRLTAKGDGKKMASAIKDELFLPSENVFHCVGSMRIGS